MGTANLNAQHVFNFDDLQSGLAVTDLRPAPKTYSLPVMRVSMVRERTLDTKERFVTGPDVAADIMRDLMGEDLDRECLVCLLVNTKNAVIALNVVSVGDLSSSITNPREVFKPAVIVGAASIILGHNHPSGDPTPSPDDVSVTRRVKMAGDILGIELLDHLVLGDCHRFVSMKERGVM